MKKYLFAVVSFVLSTSAFGAPLSSEDWNGFYSTTRSSCISNQSNYIQNYGIPVGKINEYCSCYAKVVTNEMTYELLDHIDGTGDKSQLVTIANNAGTACAN